MCIDGYTSEQVGLKIILYLTERVYAIMFLDPFVKMRDTFLCLP